MAATAADRRDRGDAERPRAMAPRATGDGRTLLGT